VLSGITRASTGFPVNLSSSTGNWLQGSHSNRVSSLPRFAGLQRRSFEPQCARHAGHRRVPLVPGMFKTDPALRGNLQLAEAKTLQFRLETFNLFNQGQFFGPAAPAACAKYTF